MQPRDEAVEGDARAVAGRLEVGFLGHEFAEGRLEHGKEGRDFRHPVAQFGVALEEGAELCGRGERLRVVRSVSGLVVRSVGGGVFYLRGSFFYLRARKNYL